MTNKPAYILAMIGITASCLGILYFSVFLSLPYSWYTDVKSLEYHDVCVGSDRIKVTSERHARWDMLGSTYAEIVKLESTTVIETTIKRGDPRQPVTWGYESETDYVVFDTRWSEPFTEVGRYGVNSWNTIYPLPFIEVSELTPARDNQFNVVECDPK